MMITFTAFDEIHIIHCTGPRYLALPASHCNSFALVDIIVQHKTRPNGRCSSRHSGRITLGSARKGNMFLLSTPSVTTEGVSFNCNAGQV